MSAHVQTKKEHLQEIYNKIDGILRANNVHITSKLRQELTGMVKEERRDAVQQRLFSQYSELSIPERPTVVQRKE